MPDSSLSFVTSSLMYATAGGVGQVGVGLLHVAKKYLVSESSLSSGLVYLQGGTNGVGRDEMGWHHTSECGERIVTSDLRFEGVLVAALELILAKSTRHALVGISFERWRGDYVCGL